MNGPRKTNEVPIVLNCSLNLVSLLNYQTDSGPAARVPIFIYKYKYRPRGTAQATLEGTKTADTRTRRKGI